MFTRLAQTFTQPSKAMSMKTHALASYPETAWEQLIPGHFFPPTYKAKNVRITIFKPRPLHTPFFNPHPLHTPFQTPPTTHTSFREVTDTAEVLGFLERLGFLIRSPFSEEVGVAP